MGTLFAFQNRKLIVTRRIEFLKQAGTKPTIAFGTLLQGNENSLLEFRCKDFSYSL